MENEFQFIYIIHVLSDSLILRIENSDWMYNHDNECEFKNCDCWSCPSDQI